MLRLNITSPKNICDKIVILAQIKFLFRSVHPLTQIVQKRKDVTTVA